MRTPSTEESEEEESEGDQPPAKRSGDPCTVQKDEDEAQLDKIGERSSRRFANQRNGLTDFSGASALTRKLDGHMVVWEHAWRGTSTMV